MSLYALGVVPMVVLIRRAEEECADATVTRCFIIKTFRFKMSLAWPCCALTPMMVLRLRVVRLMVGVGKQWLMAEAVCLGILKLIHLTANTPNRGILNKPLQA